jgi:hypothetical protein
VPIFAHRHLHEQQRKSYLHELHLHPELLDHPDVTPERAGRHEQAEDGSVGDRLMRLLSSRRFTSDDPHSSPEHSHNSTNRVVDLRMLATTMSRGALQRNLEGFHPDMIREEESKEAKEAADAMAEADREADREAGRAREISQADMDAATEARAPSEDPSSELETAAGPPASGSQADVTIHVSDSNSTSPKL